VLSKREGERERLRRGLDESAGFLFCKWQRAREKVKKDEMKMKMRRMNY